jgi:protein TonB
LTAAAVKLHAPLPRFAAISAGVHFFVFTAASVWGFFYSRPQFAVEVAPVSIDVMIIAEDPPVPEEKPVPLPELAEAIPVPQAEVPQPLREDPDPLVSDPLKGAQLEAKPDYLRNPAPVYPREARRKGWEGLVLLNVAVSREGIPFSVSVEQSSGHVLLDEVAAKTVRAWQFLPARIGDVPVEASVRVPVRFELKDSKHF